MKLLIKTTFKCPEVGNIRFWGARCLVFEIRGQTWTPTIVQGYETRTRQVVAYPVSDKCPIFLIFWNIRYGIPIHI